MGDAHYTTKKVYKALAGRFVTPKPILDIWKTCNIPRHKFFMWLLLYNTLNTKELMMKKKFHVEFFDCVLCDSCPEECVMHLFFECSFNHSFWWALGIEWNPDYGIHEMIQDARSRYSFLGMKDFPITCCWSIWEQRNDAIFSDIV